MVRSDSMKEAQKRYYEKKKNDTEFKQKRTEAVKRYYAKMKDSEEFREKANQRARDYYQRNREKILDDRKEKYRMNKKNNEEI